MLPDDPTRMLKIPAIDVIEHGAMFVFVLSYDSNRDDSIAKPQEDDVAGLHFVHQSADLPDLVGGEFSTSDGFVVDLPVIRTVSTRSAENDVVLEEQVVIPPARFAAGNLPDVHAKPPQKRMQAGLTGDGHRLGIF